MSDIRGKSDKAQPVLPAVPRRAELSAELPKPESRALAPSLPRALAKAATPRPGIANFDKAFPVFVSSPRGLLNGVGRNISAEGMFVETREPCGIGTIIRITFTAPELETEITAVAEVRFQCYLNFSGQDGEQEGVRGMGVRFLSFEADDGRPTRPVKQ